MAILLTCVSRDTRRIDFPQVDGLDGLILSVFTPKL